MLGGSSAIALHVTPNSSRTSLQSEVRNDDTTSVYSYRSTVSTNYTMSNLPGPGRLLGNFYSWLGTLFEKHFEGSGNLARSRTNFEAEAMLRDYRVIYSMLRSGYTREVECVCRILLTCAGSTNSLVQIRAFWTIIDYSIEQPSKIRAAFMNIFQEGMDAGEIVISSWKKPGIKYSIWWEYYYKLVIRCLSVDSSPLLEAARSTNFASRDKKFSDFERILLNRGDTTDSLLAIRFVSRYWAGRGIESYVRKRGFANPALVNFSAWLITHWEVHFAMSAQENRHLSSLSSFWTSGYLICGLWRSIQSFRTDELEGILEDDSQLVLWVHIYTLHFILPPWKNLCHDFLTNAAYTKLSTKLSQIEESHGHDIRKRFPPEQGSPSAEGMKSVELDAISLEMESVPADLVPPGNFVPPGRSIRHFYHFGASQLFLTLAPTWRLCIICSFPQFVAAKRLKFFEQFKAEQYRRASEADDFRGRF
ncbi:hypothetical protein SCHPADRAFT_930495, partial [Schizopora paradoxa]